ncbi:Uncharacterized protein FKW44_018272, partial [Caligus rogercresseyi]
ESKDNWGVLYPPEDKDPPEDPEPRDARYRVASNWITDMEELNEIMCEEDYLVNEKGQLIPHPLSLSYDEFSNCEEKPKKKPKRKRSPSPLQTPKKKMNKG